MSYTPNSIWAGRCQISVFQYRCLHNGQENSARCRSHYNNQPCIPEVVYTEEIKDRDCAECVMRRSGYASDEIYMNTPDNTPTKPSGRDDKRELKRPGLFNRSRGGIKRRTTPSSTGGNKLARSKDITSYQARGDELRYRRAIVKSRSESGYRTPTNTPTNAPMKATTNIAKKIPKKSRMGTKAQLKSKMEFGMTDEMDMDMEMEGYGDEDDVSNLSRKMHSLTCD